MRWFLACSLSLLILVMGLIVALGLRNSNSNKKIYSAYLEIEHGWKRGAVEDHLKIIAPFSTSTNLKDEEELLVVYKYVDKWPLSWVSFPRIIRVRYDSDGVCIAKELELD